MSSVGSFSQVSVSQQSLKIEKRPLVKTSSPPSDRLEKCKTRTCTWLTVDRLMPVCQRVVSKCALQNSEYGTVLGNAKKRAFNP